MSTDLQNKDVILFVLPMRFGVGGQTGVMP
jgi:hypothetical protein